MSELLHPPIDFSMDHEDITEMNIVNDLVAILKLRQIPQKFYIDELEIHSAITDRVEMFGTDGAQGIAMRIKRTSVLAMANSRADDLYPSTDYLVFTVEFGEFDPYDEDESELQWQSYITAIVDREHWEDPEIVETANGHRLDDLGLMRAASIIDQMKKDAVSMALGDELFLGHSEPEYAQPGILSTIATTAAELTAPLYDADSCKSCLENGTVCHHPQAN